MEQPKVFLMDEPLSNLDAKLRAQMRVELIELHKKLKAHHYNTYEEIINLCDLMCLFDTMTMEKRLIDLLVRKGVHENTHYHIVEALKLKEKFEKMLGHNLYDLFPHINY